MPHRTRARALVSAVATALAASLAAPPSFAQSAPTSSFQVIELDYAPAQPTPGLDLRPGRYLLLLRQVVDGRFEGVLRGPRNELVAERIAFSANSACNGRVPERPVLRTRALPAQLGLNLLRLEVADGAGACTLVGDLSNLGLTLPEKPPQPLECEQPTELPEFGAKDPGPLCNLEEWELPLAPPRPDLEPGPAITIGGKQAFWRRGVQLSPLDASAVVEGRCVFEYAYSVNNSGRAPSEATDASLLLENRFGLQLDAQTLGGLSAGGSQRVLGRVALPAGTWQIFVHADARARVPERNGQNNVRSLLVEVAPDCARAAAR